MQATHYLDESHILLFLLQLLVLLGVARTLGALCEEVKIPALAGEIVAGVVLGPTLLGRIAPNFQVWLFPLEPVQSTMLETVSWLGVFFLLLSSGFHVDVRRAVKQGRAAVSVGIIGVVVPIAIGFPVFWTLEAQYWGVKATRLSFSLFMAVAGSITAISVVARALRDTGLSKSPEGRLALSACAVNDLFGWFLFTFVISIATATRLEVSELVWTSLGIIGFVAACLFIGTRAVSIAAGWVRKTSLPQPTAMMSLVVTTGLLCGAITQWLGIHAILGFFLAGSMAGSANYVGEELKGSLTETLHAIFVPVFFATLGLKIDFLTGMEIWLAVVFTAVAMGGKFLGAWLGGRLAHRRRSEAILLGMIFVPGGAMEIVIGTLAIELELISQTVFVAIVFAALLSSILAGPAIAWGSKRRLADAIANGV